MPGGISHTFKEQATIMKKHPSRAPLLARLYQAIAHMQHSRGPWLLPSLVLLPVSLLLLLGVLAACGGDPAAQQEPTLTITVQPATQDEADEADEPTSEPTDEPTSEPTDEPTSEPEPTAEPTAVPSGVDIIEGEVGAGGYPILSTPELQFGTVAHLYYTDYERTLQLVQNAGFGWVRQQIHWKDTELDTGGGPANYSWEQLDLIVEAVNRYDLKLMVSIVRSPPHYTADGSDGLPADPKNLGDFVEDMARRYGNQIHAYEIWNEQNLAHETGGTITIEDAGRYVEILREAYTRIKGVNPRAFVIVGAPSPTNYYDPAVGISDLEYFRAMYEYKDGIIDGYFDAQGVHPAGSANPPDTLWPDNPSDAEGWTDDSTFYFRHIENVRDIMQEYGLSNHNIWITEFGWATENVTPGYEYGSQVSFEDQAAYISRAMEMTYEEYPWVGNMFLWNMNFAVTWGETDPPQPLHEQAAFGILNPNWEPRPAYYAVQETIARLQERQASE
jgi:hypothetical protein